MIQEFVDRDSELGALEEEARKRGGRLAIIYGRRRVGKTEIVRKFLDGRWGAYYLADRRGTKSNMEEMQCAIEESGIKDFSLYRFDGWASLFKKLAEEVSDRYVLIIDEFPYLVESDTMSEFQKAWDLYLKNSKVFLILVGSSISMMSRLTLDYSSPLYGRRTMQMRVKKLSFDNAWKFLPEYELRDFLAIYGVTDGIPYYLLQMNGNLGWEENIKRNALSRTSVLYEEAEFLLRMELREFRRYYPILEAIATGRGRFNEIVDYSGLDSASLSKYLKNLRELGVVAERQPVLGGAKNRRYVMADNYFNFYFGFIKPYRRYLEIGEIDTAWQKMKDAYRTYLGRVFEDVVREYLSRKYPGLEIGSWWNRKGEEIDIVGVDKKNKTLNLGEIKLGKSLGQSDVSKLEELSNHIKGTKKFRIIYILFAPEIRCREESVMGVTIDELERELKPSSAPQRKKQ